MLVIPCGSKNNQAVSDGVGVGVRAIGNWKIQKTNDPLCIDFQIGESTIQAKNIILHVGFHFTFLKPLLWSYWVLGLCVRQGMLQYSRHYCFSYYWTLFKTLSQMNVAENEYEGRQNRKCINSLRTLQGTTLGLLMLDTLVRNTWLMQVWRCGINCYFLYCVCVSGTIRKSEEHWYLLVRLYPSALWYELWQYKSIVIFSSSKWMKRLCFNGHHWTQLILLLPTHLHILATLLRLSLYTFEHNLAS